MTINSCNSNNSKNRQLDLEWTQNTRLTFKCLFFSLYLFRSVSEIIFWSILLKFRLKINVFFYFRYKIVSGVKRTTKKAAYYLLNFYFINQLKITCYLTNFIKMKLLNLKKPTL